MDRTASSALPSCCLADGWAEISPHNWPHVVLLAAHIIMHPYGLRHCLCYLCTVSQTDELTYHRTIVYYYALYWCIIMHACGQNCGLCSIAFKVSRKQPGPHFLTLDKWACISRSTLLLYYHACIQSETHCPCTIADRQIRIWGHDWLCTIAVSCIHAFTALSMYYRREECVVFTLYHSSHQLYSQIAYKIIIETIAA